MKRSIIILLTGLASLTGARAQDFKIGRSTGKMLLNLSSVLVEGYNGKEITFSSQRAAEESDPRAKGLQAISGSGFIDNTGLGISVTEKGTNIEVNQVAPDVAIKILVPKGMVLSFACHKVANAGKVSFKDLENEIEVSTDYNAVELENVTGPVSIRTIYGAVDVRFSAPVRGPVSITSVYSTVDVAIPVDTKATIKLNSSYGSIMASADLKIELEKNAEGDMVYYGNTVKGKINGGGTDFKLTSEYSKIYLRKTK